MPMAPAWSFTTSRAVKWGATTWRRRTRNGPASFPNACSRGAAACLCSIPADRSRDTFSLSRQVQSSALGLRQRFGQRILLGRVVEPLHLPYPAKRLVVVADQDVIEPVRPVLAQPGFPIQR